MRSKMMDIHKASQDKIRAILTDDQKTKYDATAGRDAGQDAGAETAGRRRCRRHAPPQ